MISAQFIQRACDACPYFLTRSWKTKTTSACQHARATSAAKDRRELAGIALVPLSELDQCPDPVRRAKGGDPA